MSENDKFIPAERVEGLVTALEFYANSHNYEEVFCENENGRECEVEEEIYQDNGDRAQVALAKYRGEVGE